jgi:Mg-chelatase subunit ChlD
MAKSLLQRNLAAFFLALLSAATVWAQRVPTGLRGNSGNEHDYAHVTVFGIEAKGSKFVYVFDRSGSMEGAPLAAAKKQWLDSLQPLGETQQFDILFFNHRVVMFDGGSGQKRTMFATDRNKQLAAEFVERIAADGGTDRALALKRALMLQPDVIFFLSDEDKPMPAKELEEIAKANDRVGAQICTIEFGRGEKPPAVSSMAELAHANNGKYAYVDVTKLLK